MRSSAQGQTAAIVEVVEDVATQGALFQVVKWDAEAVLQSSTCEVGVPAKETSGKLVQFEGPPCVAGSIKASRVCTSHGLDTKVALGARRAAHSSGHVGIVGVVKL